ncbi:sugar phosphate nucleotidyltransferase [Streptosporangium lutulentum]
MVGDTAEEVREAVGDGSRFGLDVTYIRQEAPLGLAHCVLIAAEFLADEPFVMYLGDNFLVDGITELVDAFRRSDYDAQILLTRVAEPQFYGVAELGPEGEILGLEEKPEHPRSDLAIVGVYIFSPAVHAAVRAIRPSARGELEIWMPSRGSSTTAPAFTRISSTATGRTPGACRTCWSATASSSNASSPTSGAPWTA